MATAEEQPRMAVVAVAVNNNIGKAEAADLFNYVAGWMQSRPCR